MLLYEPFPPLAAVEFHHLIDIKGRAQNPRSPSGGPAPEGDTRQAADADGLLEHLFDEPMLGAALLGGMPPNPLHQFAVYLYPGGLLHGRLIPFSRHREPSAGLYATIADHGRYLGFHE